MALKKNSLGRGLSSLIEEAGNIQEISSVNEINIENIIVNPKQPRKQFDDELLQELADSIKQLGIIQPITVKKIEDNKFQIIAGERRFRASKLAGLKTIPAYIRTANTDQNLLEMALVENIQREELNPIEISISYQQLIEECNLTQENLSERVGKNRSTVTNYLRLLKLPAEIQIGLRNKEISMGHARALLGIEETEIQILVFNDILKNGYSVREVEEIAQKYKLESKEEKAEKHIEKTIKEPVEYNQLKQHLSKFFQTSVDFKRNSKGAGKIIVSFKSDEDLEKIIGILDKLNK